MIRLETFGEWIKLKKNKDTASRSNGFETKEVTLNEAIDDLFDTARQCSQ